MAFELGDEVDFLSRSVKGSNQNEENQKQKPVIFCGDFNSSPFSPLYDFIATGSLLLDKKQCPTLLSGQVTWDHWRKMNCLPIIPSARNRSGGTIRSSDFSARVPSNSLVCRFFAEGNCRRADCHFLHIRSPTKYMPQPRSRITHVWPDWWRELQTYLNHSHVKTERLDLVVKSPDPKKRLLEQEGLQERKDEWALTARGREEEEQQQGPQAREGAAKVELPRTRIGC
mmetsp:Transcript_19204/g.63431  ORF Transcript_19204/g.63431 Transcript_19204/m.63431 type:complete len:228 (+) Transcript_19204:855-1538(+)